jgi:hypothetical protein
MKKLLTIAFLLSCSFVNAQRAVIENKSYEDSTLAVVDSSAMMSYNLADEEAYSPTTLNEYTFAIKDYILNKSLKGYKTENINIVEEGKYTFRFDAFIKENETYFLRGIIVLAKSEVSGRTYSLCIPIGNKELEQRYSYQIFDWDSDMRLAYSKALSKTLFLTTFVTYGLVDSMKEK